MFCVIHSYVYISTALWELICWHKTIKLESKYSIIRMSILYVIRGLLSPACRRVVTVLAMAVVPRKSTTPMTTQRGLRTFHRIVHWRDARNGFIFIDQFGFVLAAIKSTFFIRAFAHECSVFLENVRNMQSSSARTTIATVFIHRCRYIHRMSCPEYSVACFPSSTMWLLLSSRYSIKTRMTHGNHHKPSAKK